MVCLLFGVISFEDTNFAMHFQKMYTKFINFIVHIAWYNEIDFS